MKLFAVEVGTVFDSFTHLFPFGVSKKFMEFEDKKYVSDQVLMAVLILLSSS